MSYKLFNGKTVEGNLSLPLTNYSNTSPFSSGLTLNRSRGTIAAPTSVQASDLISLFSFNAYVSGSGFVGAGSLLCEVVGSFTTNPSTAFVFSVARDGGAAVDALRLQSSQMLSPTVLNLTVPIANNQSSLPHIGIYMNSSSLGVIGSYTTSFAFTNLTIEGSVILQSTNLGTQNYYSRLTNAEQRFGTASETFSLKYYSRNVSANQVEFASILFTPEVTTDSAQRGSISLWAYVAGTNTRYMKFNDSVCEFKVVNLLSYTDGLTTENVDSFRLDVDGKNSLASRVNFGVFRYEVISRGFEGPYGAWYLSSATRDFFWTDEVNTAAINFNRVNIFENFYQQLVEVTGVNDIINNDGLAYHITGGSANYVFPYADDYLDGSRMIIVHGDINSDVNLVAQGSDTIGGLSTYVLGCTKSVICISDPDNARWAVFEGQF